MQLTINGKDENVNNGISVSQLLEIRGVKTPEMVTVEVNGEILDKTTFNTMFLKQNDQIEVLFLMGGGNFLKRNQHAKFRI